MFGNTEDTRIKTEDKQNAEQCYGGMRGRLSYENLTCRTGKKRAMAFRIATVIAVCLVLALLAALCMIAMFRTKDHYAKLYYPDPVAELSADTGSSKFSEHALKEIGSIVLDYDTALYTEVTNEMATRYRVPEGVMLKRVEGNSKAAAVGFEAGDIIVAIGSAEIRTVAQLEDIIESKKDHTVSAVKVFRHNEYYIIRVIFE